MSFDANAAVYDEMRPDYTLELYADIFDYISINENSYAMEIGIGSGQATLPILNTGCQLTAVEYGENFADFCRVKFKDFSNFNVEVGKFEDYIDINKTTYDLIYSATAFHWIDEKIGYKKVFDMLKNGGAFARFANRPYIAKDKPNLQRAIQRVYDTYMNGSKKPNAFNESQAQQLSAIAEKYGFADIRYYLYHRERVLTSKEYVKLLFTYSDHIAIEERKREKFFSEIESVIDCFGGKITIYDTIDLELARKPAL